MTQEPQKQGWRSWAWSWTGGPVVSAISNATSALQEAATNALVGGLEDYPSAPSNITALEKVEENLGKLSEVIDAIQDLPDASAQKSPSLATEENAQQATETLATTKKVVEQVAKKAEAILEESRNAGWTTSKSSRTKFSAPAPQKITFNPIIVEERVSAAAIAPVVVGGKFRTTAPVVRLSMRSNQLPTITTSPETPLIATQSITPAITEEAAKKLSNIAKLANRIAPRLGKVITAIEEFKRGIAAGLKDMQVAPISKAELRGIRFGGFLKRPFTGQKSRNL